MSHSCLEYTNPENHTSYNFDLESPNIISHFDLLVSIEPLKYMVEKDKVGLSYQVHDEIVEAATIFSEMW